MRVTRTGWDWPTPSSHSDASSAMAKGGFRTWKSAYSPTYLSIVVSQALRATRPRPTERPVTHNRAERLSEATTSESTATTSGSKESQSA